MLKNNLNLNLTKLKNNPIRYFWSKIKIPSNRYKYIYRLDIYIYTWLNLIPFVYVLWKIFCRNDAGDQRLWAGNRLIAAVRNPRRTEVWLVIFFSFNGASWRRGTDGGRMRLKQSACRKPLSPYLSSQRRLYAYCNKIL